MHAVLLIPIVILMQQPAGGASPQPAARQAPAPLVLPGETPRTRYDTAMAAVSFIADRVAAVRSELDRYQRVLFSDTEVRGVESAAELGRRCVALEEAARRAPRALCLDCMNERMRPPMTAYRAALPQLAAATRSCAAALRRLSSGEPAAARRKLRDDHTARRRELIGALTLYERRLGAVLVALRG